MIRSAGPALRPLSVSLLMLFAASVAVAAQPTPPTTPGGIAATIKGSNNPQEIRPAVEAFMQTQFTALAGEPEAAPRARALLQSEAALMQGATNTATPVYTDVYCQVLNQQLENLARNQSLRARLNGAIVLNTVAQLTQNINLRGAAVAFLSDQSDAVVLWAIKASRWILPTIVRVQPIDMRVINAVVAAAKAHPKGSCGGAIMLEAYDALSLNAADRNVVRTLTKPMIAAVVPAMQDLLAFRLMLYQKGIPPEFHAERRAAFFLIDSTIWAAQTDAQKLQTIQLLSDLISLVANQATQPNVPPGDRTELLVSIGIVSRSMHVAASAAGVKSAVTALEPLTRLVDPNTARLVKNEEVVAAVAGVYQALKADKTFAGIKPPPATSGHEQAPPPASAPTTGPVVIPGAGPTPPPGATPPPAPTPAPTPAPKAPGAAPKPPPNTAPKAPGPATAK